MAIDHLSLSTTPIILRNNDDEVSQGTGFLFLRESENEQAYMDASIRASRLSMVSA